VVGAAPGVEGAANLLRLESVGFVSHDKSATAKSIVDLDDLYIQ
jgi:hypothetical protein